MPRKESIVNASTAQAQQDSASMGIDAYELPKSVVTKLARSALPDNSKMQKEMLLAVLKGSTVFVNYLGAAHEVASSRQHKSISASDVLRALEQMDMGDLVPKLQAELEVYRNNQKGDKGKKGVGRGKAKDTDSVSANTGSAKAKGKEKAAVITIPANASAPASSGKTAQRELDEDAEMETQSTRRQGNDEDEEMQDMDPEEDEGDVDEDEPEDEGEGDDEGEEIVDTVALEEEELRKDGRGVEEREYDTRDD
ncbi:hypothetical protein EIP86_003187 [Pleurotus ostreatoroseus]|nr:hypothetical protein EIP86_003187 [Pleurotus ostreatoroseus]